MANPADSVVQNLLPVQAYFSVDGVFQTFIGQGKPFFASINPSQSGLAITNSTIDSTTIGATSPSTGVFTNIATTTGTISTSPSANTDIANKYYVDAVAQGLGPKAACAVGTTANITLSGLQTIDGYTTLAGDRVLVKNQTSSQFNGIYVASATTWTRAVDMDVWSEVPGAYTVLLNGGQANTGWVCTATASGTINVTAMPWVQFSGTGAYFAGTGLTLASNTFSITNTGVSAASYGSASKTLTATVNAQGQLTALADTNIAIGATQITSGTIDTARISGSYTGITGVGTLTVGTWNASTIGVAYGGTGATTLTGYVKGSGTSAFTASATVPTTDLSGTITNAQLANSTISGVSLGSNLFSLTIGSNLSGTSYNGSAAVTIANTAPMVYPASGIPNSTGSAWGTSYSTTGSGTVLALATGATLNSPTISDYETFTAASAPTYTSGRLWYDSTLNALSYNNDVTNNTLHIGQETQLKVYNNTGSTIAKGAPVYITSTTSGFTYPLIALAKADTQTTGACIGLTNEAIATGSAGYVVINGILNGVNTGTFTVGDILYVSPYSAGQLMNTYPPTAYAVKIGTVAYVNSSSGSIYVNQSNAYVLANGIIGQVAIAQGGTNGTATPTAGGIAYGSGTAYAFSAAGTTGQVLTSAGSGTPTWTSPASSITLSDDTTTNATRYPLFAAATSGTISTEYVSSTKYQFNPSTGVLTATGFSGSGASLTSIPNSALTNSSVTIGSTSVALGATVTTFAGLTSVTSTTFVGALTGNASTATSATTATNATNIAITDNTSSVSTYYPVISSATTGNVGATTSSTKFSFVPNTGVLSATSFSGAGTGLTGTASSLSIGGNAANVTGTVAIANGGTGQTTKTSAYDALSPTTTKGDIEVNNGTNNVRLAVGTDSYVLTADSTAATGIKWAASSGGGGGTTWQSVQTTNFSATSGNGYPVNTNSGAITVTFPASPTAGNYITLTDYAGTWATNNVSINLNGNKYNAKTINTILATNRESISFVYIDTTQGWISYSGFQDVIPTQPILISYLVVAGGGAGGGGGGTGGGGGAGGFQTGSNFSLTSGTTYTITVGGGGAGVTNTRGTVGSDSVFSSITSTGGGGGGGGSASTTIGGNGGSGGGGAEILTTSYAGGSGTSGQGNAGGASLANGTTQIRGGGGGGASAAGATGTVSGNGGVGTASSITGSSVTYAGGGGGGAYYSGAAGTGGTGGGGNGLGGGGATGTNTAGTANTGGGGGAVFGSGNTSSAGGSGVVILSIPTSSYSGTTTGSPTITTSGSNTILKYTSSGSYTA
jgi:hypothetical protein